MTILNLLTTSSIYQINESNSGLCKITSSHMINTISKDNIISNTKSKSGGDLMDFYLWRDQGYPYIFKSNK